MQDETRLEGSLVSSWVSVGKKFGVFHEDHKRPRYSSSQGLILTGSLCFFFLEPNLGASRKSSYSQSSACKIFGEHLPFTEPAQLSPGPVSRLPTSRALPYAFLTCLPILLTWTLAAPEGDLLATLPSLPFHELNPICVTPVPPLKLTPNVPSSD